MQVRLGSNLHIDALTLVTTLHLLTLCRLAVRLAHRRCPPKLPAGPVGVPCTYSEESLLLIALLLSAVAAVPTWDMCDWLHDWPALALACGCHWVPLAHPAFLAPRSNANAGTKPEHLDRSRSFA